MMRKGIDWIKVRAIKIDTQAGLTLEIGDAFSARPDHAQKELPRRAKARKAARLARRKNR